MTLQTCLQQLIFIYWPQFPDTGRGSLSDTRQGLAHRLLSESLSLFSFIFAKNLAQVMSCRAWLTKFRAGSFLKLKFYRALLSEQFAGTLSSISAADTLCLQPCLQPPARLCPGLGSTSRSCCPSLPPPSPQHIHAGLFLWILCHVFYAARFMMAIYAKSPWWVHLSAQLTTGINHSLNTLVSAEPIKTL